MMPRRLLKTTAVRLMVGVCSLTSPKSTLKYLQRSQKPPDSHVCEQEQPSLPRAWFDNCYYTCRKTEIQHLSHNLIKNNLHLKDSPQG